MADREELLRLTKAQRRLLCDLAGGGCFFAALREPGDFMKDGVAFSETVGIIVHPPGGRIKDRYRVRNKTAGPLYLATPALVNCAPGDSGFRAFAITPAGRTILRGVEGDAERPNGARKNPRGSAAQGNPKPASDEGHALAAASLRARAQDPLRAHGGGK